MTESSSAHSAATDLDCGDCEPSSTLPSGITRVLESRLAELRTLGGDCSRYASVLETSYRNRRITIKPYMWRVGTHLASGEAKANGDMTLALEIDSLNVGVRTVGDVVHSMEHEAVHIAFDIPSGNDFSEVQANGYVRACRGDAQAGQL